MLVCRLPLWPFYGGSLLNLRISRVVPRTIPGQIGGGVEGGVEEGGEGNLQTDVQEEIVDVEGAVNFVYSTEIEGFHPSIAGALSGARVTVTVSGRGFHLGYVCLCLCPFVDRCLGFYCCLCLSVIL